MKFIVWLILILNVFVWGAFARRKWPERWPGWAWFGLIWIFTTHNLSHMTLAIPDPLALLLIGLSGLAFLSIGSVQGPFLGKMLARGGGVILFTIAFAMRPYFIPLLLLVIPQRGYRIAALVLCVLFYAVWYKWWILQSEFAYYATDATSFTETLQKFPFILQAFAEMAIRNATNLVGLLFLVLAFRADRDRFLWLLLAGSTALVLGLRAPMIVSHSYYLGAAVVISTLLMAQGARKAPGWTAVVFLLIGIVNVQHNWHGSEEKTWRTIQAELERNGVGPNDRIAVYAGHDSAATPNLYWAKHVGWTFHEDVFQGLDHCPEGAAWAMRELNGVPVIERCVSSPSQKTSDR